MIAGGDEVVLDTNIVVHLMRAKRAAGILEATYSLTSRRPRPIVPVVVAGEIKSIALQRGWGLDRQARLQTLLHSFPWADISSDAVIDAYAKLDSWARGAGKAIGKNDLWIAAVALVQGATVLTTDPDFTYLEPADLRVEHVDEVKLK